jgi:sucrose-6-phosphate hydrolase SacC (GH32 family)
MYVWDAWYMPVGDVVHAYHLRRRRRVRLADAEQDMLGHAVTLNLVDWEERPAAFGPDAADPRDDRQPWTGCAVWHEGRGYHT